MMRRAVIVIILGVVALVGVLLWDSYSFSNLFYNSFSSVTHKVRVYPVECKGKAVAGGLSGGEVCCGFLGIPLNPTTFTVSVSQQKVFASTLTPMEDAFHNCDVQDELNWVCTTYWNADATQETDMAHGRCFDRHLMSGGAYLEFHSDCPAESELSRALSRVARETNPIVYVDGSSWWTGEFLGWWDKHKGIWSDSPGVLNPYVTHDPLICKEPPR